MSTAFRRRLAGVNASRAFVILAMTQADPPMPAIVPIKNHNERLNMENRVAKSR